MDISSLENLSATVAPTEGAERIRRVLIVDDNSFFSFCLRTLIDREEDLRVCDMAAEETDLLERIARFEPDLLVIDLSVGRQGGLDLARWLRDAGISMPILFVSTTHPLSGEQLARVAGASFASKGGDPRRLIRRIKQLIRPPTTAATWEEPQSAVA